MPSASSLPAALRPATPVQAGEVLAAAAEAGQGVRLVGGGTRQGWGHSLSEIDLEVATTGLAGVREHNAGDLTAVLGAGTPLAQAQAAFAAAGQMLAVDPPFAASATVGGLVATADSGPMRHRHGAIRDLILGATVALPDATLARAGGKVIKNVAGYDLAKLFCGSFGTLGMIVEVVVRLHPLPAGMSTAIGATSDPAVLARAAGALARAPLELLSLDVAWQSGRGAVLARAGGSAAGESAGVAAGMLRDAGADADLLEADDVLWNDQRAGQRSADEGTVVRLSGLASRLDQVLAAVEAEGARLVGRAALGLSWITLPATDPEVAVAAVQRLRAVLSPSRCVVLDAPQAVRDALDPWDVSEGPELALARRLKARFDPDGACNPGLYVGGI